MLNKTFNQIQKSEPRFERTAFPNADFLNLQGVNVLSNRGEKVWAAANTNLQMVYVFFED